MKDKQNDRPARRGTRPSQVLATVGAVLLLGMTFAPWYKVGSGHVSRNAWQENPVVLALLLLVVLIGAALAFAWSRGREINQRTLQGVFAVTMAATLVVVFRLFIERPGGNSSTQVAFGAYPALVGINLVKAGAIVALARSRPRRAKASPAPSEPRVKHS
jgi:hypothetical protein